MMPACQAGICLSIGVCRCEAIADGSAAGDVTQIINPLGIGTPANHRASWAGASVAARSDSGFASLRAIGWKERLFGKSNVMGRKVRPKQPVHILVEGSN